jgi:hypothetical protein
MRHASSLTPYPEMRYWRRRARVWRTLFWLLALVFFVFARK